MTTPMIPSSVFSGPPVSRWRGPFPELRRDTLGFLLHCQTYGDVVKLPLGLVLELLLRQRDAAMYVLNHPADVKHVLVANQDNYRKAPVAPAESRIFGQGVLHTEGEMHHHQRRLLLPFFHGSHVTAYTDLITSKTQDFLGHWRDGTIIDIGQEMAYVTLSVIWRLLFGREVGTEADTIRETIAVGQSLIKLQYDSLLATLIPLWVPIPTHRRLTRGLGAMESMIHRFMEERRASSHRNEDVLSLLLAATDMDGRQLSDEEIRDELMTFLLAGHETTANAMSWFWYLMAQHDEARERMLDEIDGALGPRRPTADDLSRLPWTTACLQESQRYFSAVWTLARRAIEDDVIGGHHIRRGTTVLIPIHHIHHDPRWWPEPETFDPGRFCPPDKDRPRSAYLPFGGGRRICIGQSFALMEMVLMAAIMSQRFTFDLAPGHPVELEATLTLRPKNGIHMIGKRRT